MMAKINNPSPQSLKLAIEYLESVNKDDFSDAVRTEGYFLTGGIFDFFNELKVYLSAIPTAHEKIINIEAFEILSGIAYDKLKIDLGLVH
jgi:hypothetical protein